MILLNILLVLLGFTLLVVVHELGHYFAAKWAGIRVDGFAVGMGPVVSSWRRGIGLVAGSTERHVRARAGKAAIELSDEELRRQGIGETEWSLRALPLGGFVKMLGQDDLHPLQADGAKRSYLTAPIGRRMVVVSAGVIANALLAVVLFMVAFLVGVRFEAPVIGDVLPGSPAATAAPRNGAAAGVDAPGLRPGDRVLTIDGDAVRTFSDIDISAAMGHPDTQLSLTVERPGVADPLRFAITPVRDERVGLLAIGVGPARSTTLSTQREIATLVDAQLDDNGLGAAGVAPGMTLIEAGGAPVATWRDFDAIVAKAGGAALPSVWTAESGEVVSAIVQPRPELQVFTVPAALPGERDEFASGLLGLVPLVKIRALGVDSANRDVLEPGDAILRIAPAGTGEGSVDAPRTAQLLRAVQAAKGRSLELTVLRRGEAKKVLVKVNREGQIGIILGQALDQPYTATPVDRVRLDEEILPTPVAAAGILGGSRIAAVNGRAIASWSDLRAALVDATALGARAGEGASVELAVVPPIPGAATESAVLALSPEQVRSLHALGWRPPFDEGAFDPLTTLLSADGNPLRAVAMGFRETRKLVSMTYLTLYRLFQRTVGVDQLRGPVGIVHLGTAVVDHGWPYMLFFLAMISVNLAVLNFLPLPIVDGGLFLYLVYEKIRGVPPSIGFQNAATMAGLLLIVGIFVMTFYFDMMRLVG